MIEESHIRYVANCSHPKKHSCPGNRNPDSEVAAVQYEDKHWKCYRNFGHCQLDQDAAQHQATVWKLKKTLCHERFEDCVSN